MKELLKLFLRSGNQKQVDNSQNKTSVNNETKVIYKFIEKNTCQEKETQANYDPPVEYSENYDWIWFCLFILFGIFIWAIMFESPIIFSEMFPIYALSFGVSLYSHIRKKGEGYFEGIESACLINGSIALVIGVINMLFFEERTLNNYFIHIFACPIMMAAAVLVPFTAIHIVNSIVTTLVSNVNIDK